MTGNRILKAALRKLASEKTTAFELHMDNPNAKHLKNFNTASMLSGRRPASLGNRILGEAMLEHEYPGIGRNHMKYLHMTAPFAMGALYDNDFNPNPTPAEASAHTEFYKEDWPKLRNNYLVERLYDKNYNNEQRKHYDDIIRMGDAGDIQGAYNKFNRGR